MLKNSPALRVLLVEDELLIRWSISETLAQSGHTVVEAETGEGAMRAVSDGAIAPDVVLLDLRLPDTDDLSLLARLHAAVPHSALILMTAHGTAEIARDALSLGACRVMHKPFDMTEVADAVVQAYQNGVH